MFYIGDITWTISCAIAGGFLVIKSFLQLILIPIFPSAVIPRPIPPASAAVCDAKPPPASS